MQENNKVLFVEQLHKINSGMLIVFVNIFNSASFL